MSSIFIAIITRAVAIELRQFESLHQLHGHLQKSFPKNVSYKALCIAKNVSKFCFTGIVEVYFICLCNVPFPTHKAIKGDMRRRRFKSLQYSKKNHKITDDVNNGLTK